MSYRVQLHPFQRDALFSKSVSEGLGVKRLVGAATFSLETIVFWVINAQARSPSIHYFAPFLRSRAIESIDSLCISKTHCRHGPTIPQNEAVVFDVWLKPTALIRNADGPFSTEDRKGRGGTGHFPKRHQCCFLVGPLRVWYLGKYWGRCEFHLLRPYTQNCRYRHPYTDF